MKRLICGAVLLLVLGLAAGCGSTTSPSTTGGGDSASSGGGTDGKPLKAGLVYIQQANDNGWDQAWQDASAAVKRELGSDVEFTVKESVPAGPQTKQVIDGLIADGHKLIFLTAFDYGKYTIAAARAHPDVYFVQVGWRSPDLPNLSGFDLAMEDGFYAIGMALAAVDPGGKIGAIAPYAIPSILRQLNALTLGAQQIDPQAKVNTVLTNTWFNPAKDRQAVTGLDGSGAGTLANTLADPTVPQTAERIGLPWGGITEPSLGAKTNVLSALYRFDPIVGPAVKSVLDGTWESRYDYPGLAGGGIELTPFGSVYEREASAADKQKIAREIDKLKGGAAVYTGPIENAAGGLAVEDGATLSVDELQSMNFVVPGLSGIDVGK